MADERGDRPRRAQRTPPIPRGWQRHPQERMLITPLMAGLGGLLVFFAVVAVVVWLPIHTFDPPASADWAPLSEPGASRAATSSPRTAATSAIPGYSRPQDVREALYFLYPKISQPGDFYGSDQSPNLLGTERTGPDLSQEAGWHPDDWQCAHFYDPRYIDPLSLMPDMKSLFSDSQVTQLNDVRREAQRQVRAPALRGAALLEARRARQPGLPARRTRASRARTSRSSSRCPTRR